MDVCEDPGKPGFSYLNMFVLQATTIDITPEWAPINKYIRGNLEAEFGDPTIDHNWYESDEHVVAFSVFYMDESTYNHMIPDGAGLYIIDKATKEILFSKLYSDDDDDEICALEQNENGELNRIYEEWLLKMRTGGGTEADILDV